ncbi:transient receptor potential cation channel subfamily M member-like 2, partial [Glandiceps talaboti]
MASDGYNRVGQSPSSNRPTNLSQVSMDGYGDVSTVESHSSDSSSDDDVGNKGNYGGQEREGIAHLSGGRIEFSSTNISEKTSVKYSKWNEDVDVKLVAATLEIPSTGPYNVISIVGGTESTVEFDDKKRQSLLKDITKVFHNEYRTLIITSGTDQGVVKIAGEALKSIQWREKRRLMCLGITNENLHDDNPFSSGRNDAGNIIMQPIKGTRMRHVDKEARKHSLNPHHTHFIVVQPREDCHWFRRGRWFRGQLERHLSSLARGVQDRYVVLLAVGGGVETITEIAYAVNHDYPLSVVLFKGTGGATDFIEHIYQNKIETTLSGDISEQDIEQFQLRTHLYNVNSLNGKMSAEIEDEIWKDIKLIIQHRKLIQVYDPEVDIKAKNKKGIATSIHEAIVRAYVKWQLHMADNEVDRYKLNRRYKANPAIQPTIDMNMNKLLDFNQSCSLPVSISIKELQEIRMNKRKKQELERRSLMTHALRNQSTECISKLIEEGYTMNEYLSQDTLETELYGKDLHRTADVDWPHTCDTKLRNTINKYYTPNFKKNSEKVTSNTLDKSNRLGPYFRDIFLWAITTNRLDLAEYAWMQLDDPIMTSLLVSYVLKSVADKLSHREQKKQDQYLELSRQYEEKATHLIAIAYTQDSSEASKLLQERHQNWRRLTCLQLAIQSKAKMFLSHDCCQDTLRKMWFGKMNIQENSKKVYLTIPFYWLVASFGWIQFDDELEQMGITLTTKFTNHWRRCRAFYQAPVTKFGTNVVMLAMLLILYAYVIIFCHLGRNFDIPDVLVHGWIATYFTEIFREMFQFHHRSQCINRLQHFLEWQKVTWNRLAILTIATAMGSFCLRWFPETMIASRFLYAVNYFLFALRILRLYTASKTLGPMVNMIKQMFFRTLEFTMVFIIFLLGYGVAVQAFLARYSGRSFSFFVFVDVFYKPYFQTFGELFVDDLAGVDEDSGSPKTTTSILYTTLLAVHLFIGNVLLLNLLIAIFSRDIERVQEQSQEVWKFEQYLLHQEFERKPVFPPPLSIFVNIFWIGKYIIKKCRQCQSCGERKGRRRHQQNQHLKNFNRNCLSQYIAYEKQRLHNSIEARTERLEEASQNLQRQNELITKTTEMIDSRSSHLGEKASHIESTTGGIKRRTRRIRRGTDVIKQRTNYLVQNTDQTNK